MRLFPHGRVTRRSPLGLSLCAMLSAAQEVGAAEGGRVASDSELVKKLAALPDLTERARAAVDPGKPELDVYVIQGELARAHAAGGKVYLTRTPYRSPPEPCSTGQHSIGQVEVVVVNPAAKAGWFSKGAAQMVIWERTLHEVELHGGSLTGEQRRFLSALP